MVIRVLMLTLAGLFVLRLGGLGPAVLPGPTPILVALGILAALRWVAPRAEGSTVAGAREFVGRHGYALAMVAIVGLYLTIQLPGLGVDLGHTPGDIDERRLARTVSTFFHDGSIPHETVEDYPGIFYWVVAGAYLLTFLALLMQEAVGGFGEIPAATLVLVGRAVTAALFAGTIVLTGTVARRLSRRSGTAADAAGLLAALATAVAPLGVRISWQFRNEAAMSLLTVAAVASALWLLQRGDRRSALLAGGLAGLAAGVKYTGVFALLAALAAAGLVAATGGRRGRLALLVLCGFVVALALSNPFLWLDFPNFIEQLGTEVRMTGAEHWSATANPRGFYTESLARALGLPLLLLAAGGLAWALSHRHPPAWVVLALAVPYQLFMSSRPAQFDRWVYPLLPFAAALGAWAAVGVLERLRRAARRRGGAAGRLLLVGWCLAWALTLLPVLTSGAASASRRFVPSTYDRVAEWLQQRVRPGDRLLTERYWLDHDPEEVELVRVESLEAVADRRLWMGTFDWIVVPEPSIRAMSELMDSEPAVRVEAGYGWAGSRGHDFAVWAGPSPERSIGSLDLPLDGPRALRFLGSGWGPVEGGPGRRLRGTGAVYLPLRPGSGYVLELHLGPDPPDRDGDESRPIAVELEGRGLGPVGDGCTTVAGAAVCKFLLPPDMIPGRVASLELRSPPGSAVRVRRLVLAPAG